MQRMILITAVLIAGALAQDAPLELARSYTQSLYDGEVDRLWAAFTEEMQGVFGGQAGLAAFMAQLAEQLGAEAAVLEESFSQDGPFYVYGRVAAFTQFDRPVLVQWTLQADGSVAGLFVTPAEPAPSAFEAYTTQTALRLPFAGAWFVFWGGRTLAENYHAAFPDQRFAYDFVVMKDGRTHRGQGEVNEDYYCFGLPVLAPGDGTVVRAVDGIADQTPGELNPQAPLGNHVIIDHGHGEVSFLAHLQAGSVAVRAGETVRAGEVVGACGNSGNSSEPHLHYHLQRDAVFYAGAGGEGLPAQFLNYLADGELVARGEPRRGQTVQPLE